MMRLLDLFSGIGGFSLGLERSGHFQTVAFCELNPFRRLVLARHWPEVPRYAEVQTLTADRLASDGIAAVDAICGGFPCQDISGAGSGAGIEGARSGLWSHFARLIGDLRPCIVIVENVALLRSRGLGRVLGDLAALGFDAEWHCIPASAVGARHRRDRVWIVAHSPSFGRREDDRHDRGDRTAIGQGPGPEFVDAGPAMADPGGERSQSSGDRRDVASPTGEGQGDVGQRERNGDAAGHLGSPVAVASVAGLPVSERGPILRTGWREAGRAIAERRRRSSEPGVGGMADGVPDRLDGGIASDPWDVEPDIPRIFPGVKNRVGRLQALGDSLVPQIPELIGLAIGEAMEARP